MLSSDSVFIIDRKTRVYQKALLFLLPVIVPWPSCQILLYLVCWKPSRGEAPPRCKVFVEMFGLVVIQEAFCADLFCSFCLVESLPSCLQIIETQQVGSAVRKFREESVLLISTCLECPSSQSTSTVDGVHLKDKDKNIVQAHLLRVSISSTNPFFSRIRLSASPNALQCTS